MYNNKKLNSKSEHLVSALHIQGEGIYLYSHSFLVTLNNHSNRKSIQEEAEISFSSTTASSVDFRAM